MKTRKNYRFLPLGLKSKDVIETLAESIEKEYGHLQIKRIWLAYGSGVVFSALYKVFPDAHFYLIQVGKQIYKDEIPAEAKYTIHIYPSPFPQDTSCPPPYSSLANYDAKVWFFVKRYGLNGDFVWNVK